MKESASSPCRRWWSWDTGVGGRPGALVLSVVMCGEPGDSSALPHARCSRPSPGVRGRELPSIAPRRPHVPIWPPVPARPSRPPPTRGRCPPAAETPGPDRCIVNVKGLSAATASQKLRG